MIQIKEEKIAELMFDIWHKSNDLKNPVMVSNYITKELDKVKNLAIQGVGNSALGKADLIEALNNTLIANKQVGTYKGIERDCIDKLDKLIKSI